MENRRPTTGRAGCVLFGWMSICLALACTAPAHLCDPVTEGTSAKSAVLDPLGASLQDGPELYFDLVRDMAASFRTCLSEAS